MQGNTESCPTCGRPSHTMEGTFNVREGAIDVLAAPDWTRDLIRQAAEAVRATHDRIGEAGDKQDLSSEIAALTEQLSSLNSQVAILVAETTKGKSQKKVMAALGVILTLLMWLYSAEDVGNFSKDEVAPVVERILADSHAGM